MLTRSLRHRPTTPIDPGALAPFDPPVDLPVGSDLYRTVLSCRLDVHIVPPPRPRTPRRAGATGGPSPTGSHEPPSRR
jgi:hypothetical protein